MNKYSSVYKILWLYMWQADKDQLFNFSFAAYRSLMMKMEPSQWLQSYIEEEPRSYRTPYEYAAINHPYIRFWRNRLDTSNEQNFIRLFNELWNEYLLCERKFLPGLSYEDFFRAHHLGIMPREAVFEQLTAGPEAIRNIETLTRQYGNKHWKKKRKEFYDKYPEAESLIQERIVSIEENRGELDTPVTKLAARLGRVCGVKHFIRLLDALGKEDFSRGYGYSLNGGITKKEMLSSLLKNAIPGRMKRRSSSRRSFQIQK